MKKYLLLISLSLFMACSADDGGNNGSGETQNGSYSNMLVVSDFLYAVSDIELITFSLADPGDPVEIDRQELLFGVESIFHRSGILFIGSRTGMFIYTIGVDGIPGLKSETRYMLDGLDITPCDPLVANDTLVVASLSTRIQGACSEANINEIRFFDIEDIAQPSKLYAIEMEEPKGMALDDKYLFVCEAKDGIKVFDISTSTQAKLIFHYPGLETFDVIATGDILLVVGPNELYEFDYQNINELILLGQIDF